MLSCSAAGTNRTILNVLCLSVSLGARTTNVPRAAVRAGPCGCSALTVAWPDESAGEGERCTAGTDDGGGKRRAGLRNEWT